VAGTDARVAATTTKGGVRRPGWLGQLTPELRATVVGVAILLALMAAAVVVALLLMLGVGDEGHLTDSQIQYATAINAAALTAKSIANDERGFLLSGDDQFIKQLDDRTIRARGAFAVAAAEADSREQRAAVRQANEGFEAWIHALHEETDTFQAGNREQAVAASLSSTRAMRKEYEKSLLRAQELGVDAIQSARREVADDATRSLEILLGYLVVALGLGSALAFWMVRRLLRRAQALSPRAAGGDRLRRIA
jgi:methyl-accepting chemotaxis protein